MIRAVVLLLVFAALAFGQATFTLSGPPTIRPGVENAYILTLSLGPTSSVAGFQADIVLPAGWQVTAVAGKATADAGKTLTCRTDYTRCVVVGWNSNGIGAGTLIEYRVTASGSQPPGRVLVNVSQVVSAKLDGVEVASTIGAPYGPFVLSPRDINGDTLVDVRDLMLLIPLILTGTPCAFDQNMDGICNVLDALLVIQTGLAAGAPQ